MKLLSHWILATIAIFIAAYIVPGVSVTIMAALAAAIVLGALNMFVRPFLTILTLPITVLTFGLFSLVLNALIVLLAAYLVPGFVITGFLSAFLFALVLSVVQSVFDFWSGS
jgi:putative membrane protein